MDYPQEQISSMELSNRTALVTGAAKRIGRAIALQLAREGASVVLHFHTSRKEALQLRERLEGMGVQAWCFHADLSNSQEARKLMDRTLDEVQELDFLINNASIFSPRNLQKMTFEDVERNLLINSWAPFVLTRTFFQRSSEGKIVNLLDTRIKGFAWGYAPYHLSKMALAQLTKMQAVQYAPDFTVNGVAPGLILPPPGKDESFIKARSHRVPLQRSGSTSEVAKAVAYLLRSDFVTGQFIYVDGGRHLLKERGGGRG
ncbi:MAG: SDR family oxidoreductase [Candidatus Acetothermia bacterium]